MRDPRPARPRRWSGLALAGASVGIGVVTLPAFAQIAQVPVITLAQPSDVGPNARLWMVQTEGGEGGESGKAGYAADGSTDAGYLAQLSIVEGHLLAALDLYRIGMRSEAISLSHHPEAEMMDEVRAAIAAHGATDITPAMKAFSAAMERTAPPEAVEAALETVRAAIAAAAAPEAGELRARFDALTLLGRAASEEYAGSTEGGSVGDVLAYFEAHAFLVTGKRLAEALAQLEQTKPAAEKALAALAGGDEAFGDMTGASAFLIADPAILRGVAARLELIASSVR